MEDKRILPPTQARSYPTLLSRKPRNKETNQSKVRPKLLPSLYIFLHFFLIFASENSSLTLLFLLVDSYLLFHISHYDYFLLFIPPMLKTIWPPSLLCPKLSWLKIRSQHYTAIIKGHFTYPPRFQQLVLLH